MLENIYRLHPHSYHSIHDPCSIHVHRKPMLICLGSHLSQVLFWQYLPPTVVVCVLYTQEGCPRLVGVVPWPDIGVHQGNIKSPITISRHGSGEDPSQLESWRYQRGSVTDRMREGNRELTCDIPPCSYMTRWLRSPRRTSKPRPLQWVRTVKRLKIRWGKRSIGWNSFQQDMRSKGCVSNERAIIWIILRE